MSFYRLVSGLGLCGRCSTFVTSNRIPGSLPNVITHAGDLFDFSEGDMSGSYPTVLSKLEVSPLDRRTRRI